MNALPKHILAVDLGGGSMRAALIDISGSIVRRRSAPTLAHEGKESVLRRLTTLIREAAAPTEIGTIQGLGIAAPGPLDPKTGVLFTPPNLPGWRDVPLKAIFENELGIPICVGNDANLAALGEHVFGAGRGVDDLIYITVSTGIGGGIIMGGQLFLGADGLAGEIGHMAILHPRVKDGPRCNCGNIGCLEALASGTAIARDARSQAGPDSTILRLAGGDPEAITAAMVAEAARAGDPLAREVMQQAATYLGIGVLNLVHLFNPRLVIIGGGVSQAGELIFGPVREVVFGRAMPDFTRRLRIVPAALGDDAGLLGAAALVLKQLPPLS